MIVAVVVLSVLLAYLYLAGALTVLGFLLNDDAPVSRSRVLLLWWSFPLVVVTEAWRAGRGKTSINDTIEG